jgi:Phage derived protein Gp49-like (DUF891)
MSSPTDDNSTREGDGSEQAPGGWRFLVDENLPRELVVQLQALSITRRLEMIANGLAVLAGQPLENTLVTIEVGRVRVHRWRRILFAFDPRRIAILLIGGDRSGQWEEWYRRMIPLADRLYDEHLETLRQEEDKPW